MIVEPAPGVTSSTVPCASSEGDAIVCETTKPAAARAARASVRIIPTSPSGTIASPGPSEIVRTTPEPGFTSLDASGIWLAIRPAGILGSCARVTVTTY